jgi:HSP20 family molecular chaperone IbpA
MDSLPLMLEEACRFLNNSNYETYANEIFFKNDGKRIPHTKISDEDKYTIKIELPGCKKEDISIDIENSTLTIESRTYDSNHEIDEIFKKVLRPTSNELDYNNIGTTYQDGVLTIIINKNQNSKKKITIS